MIPVETHILYRQGYEACLRHIVELFETRSESFKREESQTKGLWHCCDF